MTLTRVLKRSFACLLCLVLCLGLADAALAADATGSEIRLSKVEGTVTVTGSSGKKYSTRENMRLYNGYTVATSSRSYAWITLDGTKAVKLDASSSVEVRRSGSALELLVRSGKLFFNVTAPLKSDEKLNVRTSTMIIGIRGTSGWVSCYDLTSGEAAILEGAVQVTVCNGVGAAEILTVKAGEICTVAPEDGGEGLSAELRRITLEDIPGFVLTELAQDVVLWRLVREQSGLDLSELTAESANRRLQADQTEQDLLEQQREEVRQWRAMGPKKPVWTGTGRTGDASESVHNVTWMDGDGKILRTMQVLYGTIPAYSGAIPTKSGTAQYGYVFTGWSPEITAVTEDVVYTAQFERRVNEYTVTWADGDGNILETERLAYGANPSYTGATPTKAATAQYTYTFTGWSPEVTAVTKNVTYTAQFSSKVNTYTVTWKDGDGKVLKTEQVEYGTTPSYTGDTPTKAATAQYGYTFTGWSPELAAVTKDVTYTAQFSQRENVYTVTWKDGDGNVLKTEQAAYGATPSYTGDTPTKTATAQYTYTFTGWSPDIASVTGDVTYTAQFRGRVNTYTVTWTNWDGTVLETDENVPYGTIPTYDGEEPWRRGDNSYTYTFERWMPLVSEVTGDVTYTASYTATPIK